MNEVQGLKFKVQSFFGDLKNLFKKPIIVVLSLTVLLIVAVVLFSKKNITTITGQQGNKFVPLSYNQPGVSATQTLPNAKVSFSFPKDTKIPSQVNVYRLALPNEDANREFFNRVLSSLKASESAEIKNFGTSKAYVLWKDNFSFSGNLINGSFTFTGKASGIISGPSDDTLKISVWNYLSLLGTTNNIQNSPQVSFLDYNNMETKFSKNVLLADLVSLVYPFTIDGIPTIGLGATETPLRLLVERKSGNLVRFDYALPNIDNNTKSPYSVLGLQKLTKTPLNQFRFLSLVGSDGNKIANYSVSDISSVNFNSISLAYYLVVENQDFLQPVFFLQGEAVLNDGRKGILTTVLPAVKNINPNP